MSEQKLKFKIKRVFVGKSEDAERLVDVSLRLLRLHTEQQKKAKKAA